jgi:hypothetical protein
LVVITNLHGRSITIAISQVPAAAQDSAGAIRGGVLVRFM